MTGAAADPSGSRVRADRHREALHRVALAYVSPAVAFAAGLLTPSGETVYR